MTFKLYPSLTDVPAIQLYNILKLRQDVFIIEQDCIYNDIDGKDDFSKHLLMMDDRRRLVAYLRMVPAGEKFEEWSLGRIVVDPVYRGNQHGKELIKKAVGLLQEKGVSKIRIEAQAHLEDYYKALGFKPVSAIYSVDNIPHLQMLLKIV
ncbi:MAG: GNAT family N-acetyltransferase [Balneolaceae bacterium]